MEQQILDGEDVEPREIFCAFAADAVSTHGEEGRIGYMARCPQGHEFSGALPG